MARRYVVAGLVAAALAGAAAVAVRQADGGGPDPHTSRRIAPAPGSGAAAGRIFYPESDHVSAAEPTGRSLGPATTQLFNRGPEQSAPAWPSPDRHWLLLVDGELIDLTAGKPVSPVQAVPPELVTVVENPGPQARLTAVAPWADHSRRVVLAAPYGRIRSVEVATGASTVLGRGQLPAGDPASNGAAYVVPAEGQAPTFGEQDFFVDYFAPVAAIARVASGARPVTLATRAQLVAALGGSRVATVIASHLAFSADGSRLAVELALLDGTRRSGAVVVLDRSGGIVGVSAIPYAHGLTWLAWAPTGDRLAFGIPFARTLSIGLGGDNPPFLEAQLWRPGAGSARPVLAPAPGNRPLDTPCIWSPDGTQLLCGSELSWSFLDVSARRATVRESVPGRPLAWVPAYAGSSHG